MPQDALAALKAAAAAKQQLRASTGGVAKKKGHASGSARRQSEPAREVSRGDGGGVGWVCR